jgi:hypothetical protein
MVVQLALLEVQWPAALFAHHAAAEEWGDTDDRLIYRALVRVCVRSCVGDRARAVACVRVRVRVRLC